MITNILAQVFKISNFSHKKLLWTLEPSDLYISKQNLLSGFTNRE